MNRRVFVRRAVAGSVGTYAVAGLPGNNLAQGVVQSGMGEGVIDYEKRIIQAVGIGAPNPDDPIAAQRKGALRAAKLDAMRQLLEQVKGIYLTSSTTIQNAMTNSDVITTKIDGLVRNFQVVGNPRYMSDQSVELTVSVPLDQALADIVLPEQMGRRVIPDRSVFLCPTCGQPWPEGKSVPENLRAQAPVLPSGKGVYTGLIVDAHGLGVMPAMAPLILDEDESAIYGTDFVERQYAVRMGIAGYAKSLQDAMGNERVGENPLVIKAIGAKGQHRADVVVRTTDARLLQSTVSTMNFLKKCQVLIVI